MWKNLAPNLVRQRIIIEGTTEKIVEPEQINKYLLELAKVCDMEVMSEPRAYSAHEMGYGVGFIGNRLALHFIVIPQNPRFLQLTVIPVSHFPQKKYLSSRKNISMQ